MTSSDLRDVERVAGTVHLAHPEDAAVFRERLHLYPMGCLVLEDASGVQGYVLSHPWILGRPPSLNTVLGRLPTAADTFYMHDLALLPGVRATGMATRAVELVAGLAEREGLRTLSLLAVGNSLRFWQRNGFQAVDLGIDLSSYGAADFMIRAGGQNPNM